MLEPQIDLNWKDRPSFRFTKCDEKLPFICERIRRTPGPCLSSPVKIEKSEDEKFNTNLEFNLGIDTEELLRNIGLDQLGIEGIDQGKVDDRAQRTRTKSCLSYSS